MKKKISRNKWDFSSHVAPGVGTWSLNLIDTRREEDAIAASEKKILNTETRQLVLSVGAGNVCSCCVAET
jgi:hypothetical protein